MEVTEYRTAAEMLADHPMLNVDAIRFRLTRFLEGEQAAIDEAGSRAPLMDRWHSLVAKGAKERRRMERDENRRVSVHKKQLLAERKREEEAYLIPLHLSPAMFGFPE